MSELQAQVKEALCVFEKYGDDRGCLPGSYHGLLRGPFNELLRFIMAMEYESTEQQAALAEIEAVCGWDTAQYRYLENCPGCGPIPAKVNPDLSWDADRCGRLRRALEGLVGEEAEEEEGEESSKENQLTGKSKGEKVAIIRRILEKMFKANTDMPSQKQLADAVGCHENTVRNLGFDSGKIAEEWALVSIELQD